MEGTGKKIPCQGTSCAGTGKNIAKLSIKEKQMTDFNVLNFSLGREKQHSSDANKGAMSVSKILIFISLDTEPVMADNQLKILMNEMMNEYILEQRVLKTFKYPIDIIRFVF